VGRARLRITLRDDPQGLLEQGQERLHLAGPQDTSTGRERASAFRHSLRVHGLPLGSDHVLVCPAYTEQAGVDAATYLLASGQEFTAIVAGNDLPLVGKLAPPLTTVALPLREMGAPAARMLLAEIDDTGPRGPVAQLLLGVELAVRGSTGPVRRL
jgi:LacI family transcriptional regulator